MERLSRRKILGAAGAFAGGSALAGAAVAQPIIGGDEALIASYRRLQTLLPRWDRQPALSDHEAADLSRQMYVEIEFINATAPSTLAGAAVKLRVLADPDNGMEAGERDDDYMSLRQIAEFVARQAKL